MAPKYLPFLSKCQKRNLKLSDFKLLYKATRDGDKVADIIKKL